MAAAKGKQTRLRVDDGELVARGKPVVWLDLPSELREAVCKFSVSHFSRSHATLVLRALCKDSRDLVNEAILRTWDAYEKLQHDACVYIRMQEGAHRNSVHGQIGRSHAATVVQMDERTEVAVDELRAFACKIFGPSQGQLGMWLGGRDVGAFLSALTRSCAFCRRTMSTQELSQSYGFGCGRHGSVHDRPTNIDVQCSLGLLCHEQCCKPYVCKMPWQSGFNPNATGHGPSGRMATMMLALSHYEDEDPSQAPGSRTFFTKREDIVWHADFDNAIETLTVRAKAWRHAVLGSVRQSALPFGATGSAWTAARAQWVMLDQHAGLPWRECGLGILGMQSKEDENQLVVKAAKVRQWKEACRAIDKSATRDRRGDRMRQKLRALNNWMAKNTAWRGMRHLLSEYPSADAVLRVEELHSESNSGVKRAVSTFEDIVRPKAFGARARVPASAVEHACLWSRLMHNIMHEVLQSKAYTDTLSTQRARLPDDRVPYSLSRHSLVGFCMAPLLLRPCADRCDPDGEQDAAWFEPCNNFASSQSFSSVCSAIDTVPVRVLLWARPVHRFCHTLAAEEALEQVEGCDGGGCRLEEEEEDADHLQWNASMATMVFEASRGSGMRVSDGAGATATVRSFDRWPTTRTAPEKRSCGESSSSKRLVAIPLQMETTVGAMRHFAREVRESDQATGAERRACDGLVRVSERLVANIRGNAPDPRPRQTEEGEETSDQLDARRRTMTQNNEHDLIDAVRDLWTQSARRFFALSQHVRNSMSTHDVVSQACAFSFPAMATAFGFAPQLIGPYDQWARTATLQHSQWTQTNRIASAEAKAALAELQVPLGAMCTAMAIEVLRPSRLARLEEELAVSKQRVSKYDAFVQNKQESSAAHAAHGNPWADDDDDDDAHVYDDYSGEEEEEEEEDLDVSDYEMGGGLPHVGEMDPEEVWGM